MFRLGADLKVYLHREPIDFRPASTALRSWCRRRWSSTRLPPAVFAFCNRRRDRMKLLFFDRSGL
ncbi:hypothetical protein F2981_30150 (plasmid) [Sinorhizobium meliloti]|nr:hypothetical protein [Sinorhizobium meliloti]